MEKHSIFWLSLPIKLDGTKGAAPCIGQSPGNYGGCGPGLEPGKADPKSAVMPFHTPQR